MTSTTTSIKSYQPRTPWSAVAASLATVAIIVAGLLASAAAMVFVTPLLSNINTATGAALLTFQVVVVGCVLLAAGLFGGPRAAPLALAAPLPGLGQVMLALAGMVALLAPLNALVFVFARDTIVADLKPFQDMIRSPAAPLLAVALAIGAPLSEELTFRGFLQSALVRTRLGFLGASLITTVAWTILHISYSWIGLTEVFLIGLYFCWLLWRTGNLWLPLICHGAYNALIFLVLLYVPLS